MPKNENTHETKQTRRGAPCSLLKFWAGSGAAVGHRNGLSPLSHLNYSVFFIEPISFVLCSLGRRLSIICPEEGGGRGATVIALKSLPLREPNFMFFVAGGPSLSFLFSSLYLPSSLHSIDNVQRGGRRSLCGAYLFLPLIYLHGAVAEKLWYTHRASIKHECRP